MNENIKPERARSYAWEDPQSSAAAIATMTGLDFMLAIKDGRLPRPPIVSTLGMGIEDVSEGRAVFSIEPLEYLYNPIGAVHGGVAATLVDSAASCAVHTTLKRGEVYTTVNLSVDYFKALSEGTGRVRCIGTIVRRGARLAVADAEIKDAEGAIYGRGSVTCLIFPLKTG